MKSFLKFSSKQTRRRAWLILPRYSVLERLEDRALLTAPTLDNPIVDQIAGVQSAFTFMVPSNTFSDADVGDTLTLSATLSNGNPLPSWLMFTSATNTFTGMAGVLDVGSIDIKVTATDQTAATAEDTFQLTVPPNQAPSFTKGADQVALEDSGLHFATTFSTGQNVNVSKLPRSQTEVHIAINPTNPQNVVIVSNGGGNDPASEFIANSFDGGNTWTIRNLGVAHDGVIGAFPQRFDGAVAFDRFGNLHVVYIADPDINAGQRTTVIVYATSSDGGSTFSARTLTDVAANIDKPWIAVGPFAGDPQFEAVYVTYQNQSSLLAVRGAVIAGIADVGSFSTEATITSSTNAKFAVPAVGPTGQLSVTWMEVTATAPQGPSNIMFGYDEDGVADGLLSFGTPTLITSTQVGPKDVIPASPQRTIFASPYLAYDVSNSPHQGRLYCAYADESPAESNDTNIFVRYSDDNGTIWSSPVRVNDDTTTRSQFFQNISVDPVTGHVFLSWYDARNDSGSGGIDTDNTPNTDVQYFVAVSIDGGATFSANVQVSKGRSTQSRDISSFSGNDFGDYTGIAAYNDVVHFGWADNSNSTADNPDGTFDVYTDRLNLLTGWATNIQAGPPYESGQTLSFVVTTDNNSLFSVLPSISSAGVLTYTTALNANGIANVTVRLMDNGGTTGGGVDTSAAQTFKITVTPVNDVPSFTKGADQKAVTSAGLQSVAGWATDIRKGPANESAQVVDFIVTTDTPELFSVQPMISPSGTLTYTPVNGSGGTATVTVKIHDNGGTANGGVDTSSEQTFTITTFVPNVVYSAVGSARMRAFVVDGLLNVQINGINYPTYQPECIETLTINGGSRNDEIDLSGLSPLIYTRLTSVVINGGKGNDRIVGSFVGDLIDGGAGNDTLTGGLGDDTLIGNTGTDLLFEFADVPLTLNNTSLTGLGTDQLATLEKASLAGGDSGVEFDASAFTRGSVTLTGGAGNDTLIGGSKNDAITGRDGDDELSGGAGNDTILGGFGEDTLNGDAGNDLLIGGFDDDEIDGGSGRDTAVGGQGGSARGGDGIADDGDMIMNSEVISEAFKKLFAFE